jgi:hypothetical protein
MRRLERSASKEKESKAYLRLTDFTNSNGPDVHVVLARAGEPALSKILVAGELDYVELDSPKGNQGDQNHDVPARTDLEK